MSSMSSVGGFRSSSMGSGNFGAPSQWLASRAQTSPGGHPGALPIPSSILPSLSSRSSSYNEACTHENAA